jgi:hypothetical protein
MPLTCVISKQCNTTAANLATRNPHLFNWGTDDFEQAGRAEWSPLLSHLSFHPPNERDCLLTLDGIQFNSVQLLHPKL